MRVRVEVQCAALPVDSIADALRAAGNQLASAADSVSVEVCEGERLVAILEFEMKTSAQYKVVDDILATVKLWAWQFYEDITVRFPSIKP